MPVMAAARPEPHNPLMLQVRQRLVIEAIGRDKIDELNDWVGDQLQRDYTPAGCLPARLGSLIGIEQMFAAVANHNLAQLLIPAEVDAQGAVVLGRVVTAAAPVDAVAGGQQLLQFAKGGFAAADLQPERACRTERSAGSRRWRPGRGAAGGRYSSARLSGSPTWA